VKKSITKILSLCLAAALCLSLCGFIGTASAATYQASTLSANTVTIKTGVKIYIVTYDANGNEVKTQYVPTDVNGKEVAPFIIEDVNGGGTTYLPIRAISKIFGATDNDIVWDSYLKNAYLATPKTALSVTNPNKGTSTISYAETSVTAYSGVTLYVDNVKFVPTDASGKAVANYLIEDANGGGTTYFPVRAVTSVYMSSLSNASSYIVWDDTNKAVIIKSPASASTSGDTEDVDEDLISSDAIKTMISELIAKMKENMKSYLLNPLSFFSTMKDMLSALTSGETSGSSFLSTFSSLFSSSKILDSFQSIVSGSGFDFSDILSQLGGSSGTMSTIMQQFLSSFTGGSSSSTSLSGSGLIQAAIAFFIFTRALDWLF
jgi:hypothetical protein